MEKYKKYLIIIAIFFILIILGLFIYELIDFYNDYQCSTTNDLEWFLKNNCMRYIK